MPVARVHRPLMATLVATLALFTSTLLPSPADAVGDTDGGTFVAVNPTRVVSATTWAGGSGAFGSNETRTYQVLGQAGIPSSGVAAVVVDIAVQGTTATTSSYLTVWPGGTTRPAAVNLYYTQDNNPRSNTAIVKVGSSGTISVYNYVGSSNVTVDVQGYFTTSSTSTSTGGFTAIAPTRIARTDGAAEGTNVPQAKLAVGASLDIQVTGVGNIPTDATGVFANLEVRDATAVGQLKAGPGGATMNASYPSTMDYADDAPHDSGVSIALDSSGKLRLTNYSGSSINLKVDVQGYFSGDSTSGGSFTSMTPTNVYSTSTSGETLLQGGESRSVHLAGQGGLPSSMADLGAVTMTISVKSWSTGGTVTVYSADQPAPGTSNVSFIQGQGNPDNGMTSTAMVEVSRAGDVILHNSGSTTLRITLTAMGWFSPSPVQVSNRNILSAAESIANGTGTSADTATVGNAGLTADVEDPAAAPQVTAVDEDANADDPPTREDYSADGVGSDPTASDATCDPATTVSCVSGGVTDIAPQQAQSQTSTVVIGNCPSGQTARRYTVTLTQKALAGNVLYRWSHRVHYCTDNGKVTKFRARYDFLAESDGLVVREGELMHDVRSGTPVTTASSFRQRRLALCLLRVGCYKSVSPWSRLFVNGTGGKSYEGSSA